MLIQLKMQALIDSVKEKQLLVYHFVCMKIGSVFCMCVKSIIGMIMLVLLQ